MKQIILTTLLLFAIVLTAGAQAGYPDKGNAFLNSRQYDKAEQAFRDAIRSDSGNLIYQCQLGLTLIEEKKYAAAEQVLQVVLKADPENVAATWYSGIVNFYTAKDRQAVGRFEKALSWLDKASGQYYSANWFIGKCYSNLLKTDGLTYAETNRMFESYEEYLRLQPDAEDAQKIREYLERKKSRRPPDNVKIWVDL